MRRLTDTDGLTEFQRDVLRTVRDFVDAEVLPVASELDHADAYRDGIVTRLNDVEAGMAKYLAAEYCKEVVEDSLRIHGGYGYSTEHEIERLYRDAPMLLIGEGTAEIQKMIIGRRLVRDYPV